MDATTATEDELHEAASLFFGDQKFEFEKAKGFMIRSNILFFSFTL